MHCASPMVTEQDAHDCLRTNLRMAIEHCVGLAEWPAQGPTYIALRNELSLIEGAARQVGIMRSDARWSRFGWEMAAFCQRVGDAIRCHQPRKVFLAMADMMRKALYEADKLKIAKTGRRGAIVPVPKPGPHRDTRPVYFKRPSGLILPAH